MKDLISKEKVFTHSIDKVWKAISQGDEISTWFLPADFKAEVGYKYIFRSRPEENCAPILGEVLEASPYTLVYTWVIEDTDVTTKVKWVLEEEGEHTRLLLEHSGISNYVGETAIEMFDSFSGGWDGCIAGLQKYLEKELHEV